jgi:integrase
LLENGLPHRLRQASSAAAAAIFPPQGRNARTGFVEDTDYARLTANTNELWLRLFLELAYTYGWRKTELLGLRVRQCDLIASSIRLEAAQSKNGQAREVVMTAAVYEW